MRFWRRLKMAGRKPFLDSNEEIADGFVDRQNSKVVRNILIVVLIILLLLTGLGWHWSGEPDLFDVREQTSTILGDRTPVVGATTTATLIHTVDTLLHKPGGFLSNDLMPPGVLLDNIPSWEFGVLVQVRDLSKAKREAFSRSQSQSTEDPDLAIAEPRFHIDHNSWAVPWPESEYAEGQDYLAQYLERLLDNQAYDAQFFARADNLRYWLGTVETRLGSLSQRLSASVGQRRINTDLSGDAAGRQSTQTSAEVRVKTPWLQIDNVFYEARGTTWALLHFLKAIEVDFAEVLARKNAVVSLQQIIRELEMSQQPVHAPVIVNGEGFGLLANHSLVMASYISRANAAIIDLRELLSQG
jgi:hypothetical protein